MEKRLGVWKNDVTIKLKISLETFLKAFMNKQLWIETKFFFLQFLIFVVPWRHMQTSHNM